MTFPDFSQWHQPDWLPHPAVRAIVTTRAGAVSPPPWQGFNLGMHCGDQTDRVSEARAQVARKLPVAEPINWLEQVHGSRVIHAGETDNCADGIWTGQLGQACAVLTADCLPVLLARCDGTAVAAVHAGWRGLQAGVVRAGLAAIAPREQAVSAWLGPAICGRCYQVGDEVYQAFMAHDRRFQTAFQKDAEPQHWRFSVARAATIELQNLGVASVHQSALCTACDLQRFYSYRKEGQTGRFATLVWLDKAAGS